MNAKKITAQSYKSTQRGMEKWFPGMPSKLYKRWQKYITAQGN
jgi:hypothetical protein